MTRPSWHETWFAVAEVMARRASCPRASVGAVIVDRRKHLVSVGYNGAPAGEPHCIDDGCIIEDNHCQRALHAEVNAIVNATKSLRGTTIFITHPPRS